MACNKTKTYHITEYNKYLCLLIVKDISRQALLFE